MSLNETPASERIHIGFFGKRNAGKSSVMNAVTNQNLSVVSDVLGTTTDPVYKTMELLPVGPVVIIDTPGTDDSGELGNLRVEKAFEALNRTDIAILVCDIRKGLTEEDNKLISLFSERNIKYIVAYNKCDLEYEKFTLKETEIIVSAKEGININELKEKIGELSKTEEEPKHIVGDLLKKNDFVVLVTPIDASAPKGRLILPQQQTIRDIIDLGAVAIVTKETELESTLKELGKKPKLVITDSQVFGFVSKIVPEDIPLTSFSILMARYKGILESAYVGAKQLENLKDGDYVLISEGCTHHRQCEDIGTVKIPKMIKKYTEKEINFEFTSGKEFPSDLKKYSLIVHCGGCMLNRREMQYRIRHSESLNIPITNYGILIAYINGIMKRATFFLSLSERNGYKNEE